MKLTRATLLLVCTLSLPAPAQADEFGDMFGFMFRMMLTMMNVMSDVMNDDSDNWSWPGGSHGPRGYGWPPYTSPYTSPWASPRGGGVSPFYSPGVAAYPPYGAGYGFPGNSGWGGASPAWGGYPQAPYPPATSALNGKWYGHSGEVLEIRGDRFRLREGGQGIQGVLRTRNGAISLFSPETGTAQNYTFVRSRTELVLQDQTGQVLLFQKQSYPFGGYIF